MEQPLGTSSQPQAAPDQQTMYDMVVYPAMEFIFGKHSDVVRGALNGKESPSKAIGGVVAKIVGGIDKSARQAGQQIPQDVILHATKDVVGQVVSFAEKEGLIGNAPAGLGKVAEQSYFEALRQFGTQQLATGAVNQEEARAELGGGSPSSAPVNPSAPGPNASATTPAQIPQSGPVDGLAEAKAMSTNALPIASTQEEINALPSGITRR
jgi:hypothetical protein